MAKYSAAKVAQCEEWVKQHGLMEYGGAMLKEFCEEMDIDNKTYYKWMQVKDEFREAINRIPNPNGSNSPIIRKMKKKHVHYQPNVAAAIFLLTNLDPEHYQNRQRSDMVIKKDEEKQMTIEEINAEIARLEKLDKE